MTTSAETTVVARLSVASAGSGMASWGSSDPRRMFRRIATNRKIATSAKITSVTQKNVHQRCVICADSEAAGFNADWKSAALIALESPLFSADLFGLPHTFCGEGSARYSLSRSLGSRLRTVV